jgi:hypothetical protein
MKHVQLLALLWIGACSEKQSYYLRHPFHCWFKTSIYISNNNHILHYSCEPQLSHTDTAQYINTDLHFQFLKASIQLSTSLFFLQILVAPSLYFLQIHVAPMSQSIQTACNFTVQEEWMSLLHPLGWTQIQLKTGIRTCRIKPTWSKDGEGARKRLSRYFRPIGVLS